MTRKQAGVPTTIDSASVDDLRLIRGIGPVHADRLSEAGIRTYKQLAALSPAQLTAQVTGLPAKQLVLQGWISQARRLASKKAPLKPQTKRATKQTIRQHYENFTIEFLLDEQNVLRRTRVLHVQSGDADTWASLDAEQLIDFLARHAGIGLPKPKSETPHAAASEGKALPEMESEPHPTPIGSANLGARFSTTIELAPSDVDNANPVSQPLHSIDLTGTLRLCDLKAMPVDSDVPIFFIHAGEAYRLGLTLDLTDVVGVHDVPLNYKATIICKQVGGSTYLENQTSGDLRRSDSIPLEFSGSSLPPGVYRLEAYASLGSKALAPVLIASSKGGLLQVYEASRFHKSSESNRSIHRNQGAR